MPRIDPRLVPVVIDLERGLRELSIPFAIVGALVPELLLEARPHRMTNDADVTVVVPSLAAFDALKRDLADYGFVPASAPHRMTHRSGGVLDILPCSEGIAPGERLQLEDGRVLNMAGFRHVVPNAVLTSIDGGPALPVAPLPLYTLLKLVAFGDRKAPKDLAGILHCLEHYLEADDRRYGLEHDGGGVPFEYTSAYLLGGDAQPFLDAAVRRSVTAVLDQFAAPDAAIIGVVARERGLLLIDDRDRVDIFERFRWFRLGTGL